MFEKVAPAAKKLVTSESTPRNSLSFYSLTKNAQVGLKMKTWESLEHQWNDPYITEWAKNASLPVTRWVQTYFGDNTDYEFLFDLLDNETATLIDHDKLADVEENEILFMNCDQLDDVDNFIVIRSVSNLFFPKVLRFEIK